MASATSGALALLIVGVGRQRIYRREARQNSRNKSGEGLEGGRLTRIQSRHPFHSDREYGVRKYILIRRDRLGGEGHCGLVRVALFPHSSNPLQLQCNNHGANCLMSGTNPFRQVPDRRSTAHGVPRLGSSEQGTVVDSIDSAQARYPPVSLTLESEPIASETR